MASIESKNLLVAVKAFARANALPLDKDEVWGSLSEAQAYAASPTAYAGQSIKVLIDGKYKTYIIQPSGSGLALEELTASGEGSGSSIAYVQIVDELPSEGQVQGIIYILSTDNSGYIWTGSEFKKIFSDTTIEISNLQDKIDEKANLEGATFTGPVILAADPAEDMEAVTKQYVDRLISNLSSTAPGVVDSANPLPAEHTAGQTWRVAEAGRYADKLCEVGDLIICIADGEELVASDFMVVQANIDGAVTGPEASTDANIVIFDGLSGKIIKDSEVSIQSLKDAIAKAHEHKNKTILDSFTKTEEELLSAMDDKVETVKSDLQSAIDNKANSADVYTKTEVDNLLTPITENLNTKADASTVNTAIENLQQAVEDVESDANAYTDERIGFTGTTVKAYVEAAIGTGGTDSAAAIAAALAEAKDYTNTALTLNEF